LLILTKLGITHLQIQTKLPSINFHKTPIATYRFNQQTTQHDNDDNANLFNISLPTYQDKNIRNKFF